MQISQKQKNYENKPTHNILKGKYYICAIHNPCGFNHG